MPVTKSPAEIFRSATPTPATPPARSSYFDFETVIPAISAAAMQGAKELPPRSRHCEERSYEAIQRPRATPDCFASLAMMPQRAELKQEFRQSFDRLANRLEQRGACSVARIEAVEPSKLYSATRKPKRAKHVTAFQRHAPRAGLGRRGVRRKRRDVSRECAELLAILPYVFGRDAALDRFIHFFGDVLDWLHQRVARRLFFVYRNVGEFFLVLEREVSN